MSFEDDDKEELREAAELGYTPKQWATKQLAQRKQEKASTANPSHYSRWKIEPLDFISENNLDFLRGNIIKYIMRYDAKGGIDDLKKARVYLEKLIEKVEVENG